jgi:glutaredoxin
MRGDARDRKSGRMRLTVILGGGLLALLVGSVPLYAQTAESPASESRSCLEIEVFSRQGCPHCADAYAFLEQLQQDYPTLRIVRREVVGNTDNLRRFLELNEALGVQNPGVPSFFACGQFAVGFDTAETTGVLIREWLGLTRAAAPSAEQQIRTRLFDWLDVDRLGLPVFTLVLGLVDGFNPCAMWVLLFLLAMLVNLRDRKRILMIAGTFVMVSGAVYFAFMAAWLNLFLIIGFSRALQLCVGGLAMGIGVIHVKDFVAFGRGPSLSIPTSAKPGLIARIRRILQAENMVAALVGVVIVAVLVNLLELLCTAGLPALYVQILTSRQLAMESYYSYLLLYNLAYIADDALMVAIVVYTLTRHEVQPAQGRWLKLLSGIVVLVLGAALVFAPELLV